MTQSGASTWCRGRRVLARGTPMAAACPAVSRPRGWTFDMTGCAMSWPSRVHPLMRDSVPIHPVLIDTIVTSARAASF